MIDSATPWLDAYIDPDNLKDFRSQIADAVGAGRAALKIGAGPMIDQAVNDVVDSALHLDVLALLAEGWATSTDFRDVGKKTADGQTAIVRLAAHRISRDVKPVVVIHFGVAHRIPVNITISVAGSFLGIELSIKNDCITAVGTGQCELSVQPKIEGQAVGKPKIIHDWRLPGRYSFKVPIRLR